MSGPWSPSTAQRSDAAVGRTEPGPRLRVLRADPDCVHAICWGGARGGAPNRRFAFMLVTWDSESTVLICPKEREITQGRC